MNSYNYFKIKCYNKVKSVNFEMKTFFIKIIYNDKENT